MQERDNTPEIMFDRMAVNILAKSRPEILRLLISHGFGKTEAKDTVHYCGLVQSSKGRPVFFLPRQTDASNASKALDSARMTMKAMARFGREVESRRGFARSEIGNSKLIALIHELAEDFRQNGVYSERVRFATRNDGKPHWSRTLGKELPFLTDNGEPVFPSIRTRKAVDAHENPLSQIQAVILREILEKHSWWLGGISSRKAELRSYPVPKSPRTDWIRILRSYRQTLYASRALFLIEALCDYINGESGETAGAFLYGVEDFHRIWEQMLRKVLPNVEGGWNAILVKPGYVRTSDNSVVLKEGMETDIVVGVGENLCIIDAKYYDATGPNSVPGWPDLVKQIYYHEAMKIAAPTKSITNCLVFPTNGRHLPEYRSAGVFLSDKSPSPGFPEIGCQYADTGRVLQAYVDRRKDDLGVL
jgi:hypothetical protein